MTCAQFVARFTENNLDGENLARIYSRVSKGHSARDAAVDRDTAPAGPSRGAEAADDDDYGAAADGRRRSFSEVSTAAALAQVSETLQCLRLTAAAVNERCIVVHSRCVQQLYRVDFITAVGSLVFRLTRMCEYIRILA